MLSDRRFPPIAATRPTLAAELLAWLATTTSPSSVIGSTAQSAEPATDTPARYAAVPSTGLGILRADFDQPGAFHALPVPERPQRMVITKDNHKSPVHRPAYLDYIGIRLLTPTAR